MKENSKVTDINVGDIEEAVKTMERWVEYEKNNKDKINKADELIYIQETILSNYKRVLKMNEVLLKENEELKFKERSRIIGEYGNTEIHDVINKTLSNDYISVQKVKDIIDRIDYDIKKTKEIISKNTNIYASYRKNDYQIARLKAMNTKSLDIKKRLQELLESEE